MDFKQLTDAQQDFLHNLAGTPYKHIPVSAIGNGRTATKLRDLGWIDTVSKVELQTLAGWDYVHFTDAGRQAYIDQTEQDVMSALKEERKAATSLFDGDLPHHNEHVLILIPKVRGSDD